MKLSQLIAHLQQLAAQAGAEDPRVFTPPDDHGFRQMVFNAELKTLNPAGVDSESTMPVLGVELTTQHFSRHPEFYAEWNALDDAWWKQQATEPADT